MDSADFKPTLIAAIEAAAPSLAGRVQAGAVDASTPAPFAAFTTPEERPLRSKDGVVGMESVFEVSLFDGKIAGAEALKRAVLPAIEGLQIGGKTCRVQSAGSEYYPDYDLHAITVTARIS